MVERREPRARGEDVYRTKLEEFVKEYDGTVGIAHELESGSYPPCEWVEKAPQLVTSFFIATEPRPSFETGNLDRLIDAYTAFVRTHLEIRPL